MSPELADFNKSMDEVRARAVWGPDHKLIRYSIVHWGTARLSMQDLMIEFAQRAYAKHEADRGQEPPPHRDAVKNGFFVGELAILTIQNMIDDNDHQNLIMIMQHYSSEFQEACKRQIGQIEAQQIK